jgi:hypothetical protein
MSEYTVKPCRVNGNPLADEEIVVLDQRNALARAICDPALSQRDLVVLAALIESADVAAVAAFTSYRLLSERTGYTEPDVVEAIRDLRVFGYPVGCGGVS